MGQEVTVEQKFRDLAQHFLFSARTKVDARDLDGAYADLLKVDEHDDSRAKETTNLRHEIAALRQEATPSAGTSSWTSESKPDKSGSSTGTDRPLPAPSAENLSDKDQPLKPAFSSVSSMGGSGQETGSAQASQPVSSEASQAPTQATVDRPSAEALIGQAHAAFQNHEYDAAEHLLTEAAGMDATLLPDIQRYQAAVQSARTAAQGFSSEVPDAGGALLKGPQV